MWMSYLNYIFLKKKTTLKGQGTDQPTTDYRLTDKENKNNQQPKLLQI